MPEAQKLCGRDDLALVRVRQCAAIVVLLVLLFLLPHMVNASQAPSPGALPASLAIYRENNADIAPNPLVKEMIDQVVEKEVYNKVDLLSGGQPIQISDSSYTLTTRFTDSGDSIARATQYIHEQFESLGISVRYQDWRVGSHSGRNVIATITGTINPQEIVIISAHLDSISLDSPGKAPGADDNATGCAGVLTAAEIMSRYQFRRTLRFVFFTGEEQGQLGSSVYAREVRLHGDQVIAVYNMDMIGYHNTTDHLMELHTRPASDPGAQYDMRIASVFTQAVQYYGLGQYLMPVLIPDAMRFSDQEPFWENGYAAILATENYMHDRAPNHSYKDTLDRINPAFLYNMVRASIATAAHLAEPEGRTDINADQAIKTGRVGDNVNYMLVVANKELVTDRLSFTTIDNTWPVEIYPVTVILSPSMSATVMVTVTVPQNVAYYAPNHLMIAVTSWTHPQGPVYTVLTTQPTPRVFMPIQLIQI